MSGTLLQVGGVKLVISIVLAVVAWVVQRRTKNPRIAHALWLGVLVTMLVPALVRVAGFDRAQVDRAAVAAVGAAGVGGVAAYDLASGAVVMTMILDDYPSTLSIWKRAALLWLIGSGLVLLVSGMRVLRFHRTLGAASKEAPEDLRSTAVALAAIMGLRVAPAVRLTPARLSPLVWWHGRRPAVFMSEALLERLDRDQVRWILAHEMVHIKRGDHLVRLLEWLASIAFWWNPITWWAKRNLRNAEDACCDTQVFTHAPDATPRAYAGALVAVAEFLATPPKVRPPGLAIAAVSGGARSFERRLRTIMSGVPGALSSPLVRGLVVAVGIIALSLGVVKPGIATDGHLIASTAWPRQGQCEELSTEMKTGVAAGTTNAKVAAEAINNCLRFVLRAFYAAELKNDIAKGKLTEARAEENFRKLALLGAVFSKREAEGQWGNSTYPQGGYYAYQPNKKQMAALRAQLTTAVQAGQITAQEMADKLDAAKTPALVQVTMPAGSNGGCPMWRIRVKDVVSAGYATAEQGADILKARCGDGHD